MKSHLFFVLAAVLAFVFASCGSNEKRSVENAAYRYAMATANYQIDEALQYATTETWETLEIGRKLIASVGQNYVKSDTPASIDILEVGLENDTMAYAVYHKNTPIKDFSDTLRLRKREGKWLAHCPIVHHQRQEQATPTDANGNEIKRFVNPELIIEKGDSLK